MDVCFNTNSDVSCYLLTRDTVNIGLRNLSENDIDIIIETITHETLHAAIYKATHDIKTTALFDILEILNPISIVGIFKTLNDYHAAVVRANMFIATPSNVLIEYAIKGLIPYTTAATLLAKL